MIVMATVVTHPGAVRPANEDAVVVGPWVSAGNHVEPSTIVLEPHEPVVCAVADGLGGHAAGEVASSHVARGLSVAAPGLSNEPAIARALRQLHGELYDLMDDRPELAGMGSTVAGLVITQSELLWFNAGDSRVYQEDGGYLGQVSVDDGFPAITEGAARSSVVTQSLGGTRDRTAIEPHTGAQPMVLPARFLLCTDGLTDVVALDDLERALKEPTGDAAVAVMADTVMASGAPDNFSVVLVELRSKRGE